VLVERRREARYGYALLTLTVAALSPGGGLCALKDGFSTLRRRRAVRDVFCGGELHVQIEPSTSGEMWNVHAHALVELERPLDSVDHTSVSAAWSAILAGHGLVGSCDLRQGDNLSPRETEASDGYEEEDKDQTFHPAAFYVSRRVRSEWIDHSDEVLRELIRVHRGKRLKIRFGVWHPLSRRRATIDGGAS
jgi:hypothetical protein